MRLYVWRHRRVLVWFVTNKPRQAYMAGFGHALGGPHPTHAEAFADAWARTRPKEET